jgi:hypothetical protein
MDPMEQWAQQHWMKMNDRRLNQQPFEVVSSQQPTQNTHDSTQKRQPQNHYPQQQHFEQLLPWQTLSG